MFLREFLIIKPTRCTNFSKFLFWNETLHVSDSSSVHHQVFFTVHTAMVYVIQVCRQLVSRSICSCSPAVNKPAWHIPLLCVQWKTLDDGQRNCQKHVEFHSKNKFEKLVHLVGFIIRNCYSSCSILKPTLPLWPHTQKQTTWRQLHLPPPTIH
jgi:hypothetical protein